MEQNNYSNNMHIHNIRISSMFILCLCCCIFKGCNSDYIEHLGNGYFFRNEGDEIKDILCEKSNGAEIPATVLEYRYNNEYIVAKQKPMIPPDPLYKNVYIYNEGLQYHYYWIIIKKNNVIYGPLNKSEFKKLILKLNIPHRLILQ